jgi:hypothetical protein
MISPSSSKLSSKLPKIEADSLNEEADEEPIWRQYEDFNSSK